MEGAKHILLKIFDLTDAILLFSLSIWLGTIKDILGIISLCITIFYIIWKWHKEFKEGKKKNGQTNNG